MEKLSITLRNRTEYEEINKRRYVKHKNVAMLILLVLFGSFVVGLGLHRVYFAITNTFGPSASSIKELEAVIKRQNRLINRLALNNGLTSANYKILYMNTTLNVGISRDGKASVNPSDKRINADSTSNRQSKNEKLDQQSKPEFLSVLPESSVWCQGTSKEDRSCHFRNLCYNPKYMEWFIVKTNRTIQENVPIVNRYSEPLLYTSSIDNHPYFSWNYVEVSPFSPEIQNLTIRFEQIPHFMFKRLHPDNIMHALHDDVLNLYFHIKRYIQKTHRRDSLKLPFSLFSHRLLMLDEYEGTGATRPFQYLSNHKIRFSSYLTEKGMSQNITCFIDAFVGNSRITKWYQYGFYEKPQGPLDNLPNGMHIREVVEWFVKRNALPLGNDEKYPRQKLIAELPEKPDNSHLDLPESIYIVIMAREWNRKILNEKELAQGLEKEFGLETKFLRNSELTFEQQIALLRKARIVVGLHGSILVMAMFCRRGTVFIEMYPFAVPADHYTPYKTMSNLVGMDLVYRSWTNTHAENNVGHPEEHPLRGGLSKLSDEMKEKVLTTLSVPRHKCCSSPYWLYRIYQDTRVDIPEVVALIRDGLKESRMKVLPPFYNQEDAPRILFSQSKRLTCISDDPARPPGELWAVWPLPWTGMVVHHWDMLCNNNGKIYQTLTNETSIKVPGFDTGTNVIFFVRPVSGDGIIGPWSEAGKCLVV